MDIRIFKTFIQIAETKHFGKAAENLYLTQAAVSARIKQLEEFYNAKLLHRDKNNLRLTPAGELLLTHAHLMVSQLEQSKLAIELVKHQKRHFNVAITPNVWDAFLSGRIHDFVGYFKDVSLGTEISVREAIQRKLQERTLDLGILTDPIKDENFTNHLVGHFELALVGTENESAQLSDNYILVDWGLTFQKEHTLHHKWQPVMRTSTAAIALDVILANGGVAYLPKSLVAPFVEQGSLVEIDSPLVIKRPLYVVYRDGSLTAEFINKIVNKLQSIA